MSSLGHEERQKQREEGHWEETPEGMARPGGGRLPQPVTVRRTLARHVLPLFDKARIYRNILRSVPAGVTAK